MQGDSIYDLPNRDGVQRQKQRHGASKENWPPLGAAVLAVGAAAAGALLHRLHSQGKRMQKAQSDLAIKTLQLSDAMQELHSARQALLSTMEQLHSKVLALEEQQAALEAARGELGATRSRIGLIERELTATRRCLANYQGQLECARFELQSVQSGCD